MPVNVRVNQSAIELMTLGAPNVRINQSAVEFMTLPVPPVITCGNPPQGQINTAYSHAFPVSGGGAPYTFSILLGALPPGLNLNGATGVVSGTPSSLGQFNFTVQVVDNGGGIGVVGCSITILGILKITLRGVKRTRCDAAGAESEELPILPSVERAV